jgi:hypothetical protein
MAYFQTKNPNFGKFCRDLRWKILFYFMAIWSILRPFGIFFRVYFMVGCTKENLATQAGTKREEILLRQICVEGIFTEKKNKQDPARPQPRI